MEIITSGEVVEGGHLMVYRVEMVEVVGEVVLEVVQGEQEVED